MNGLPFKNIASKIWTIWSKIKEYWKIMSLNKFIPFFLVVVTMWAVLLMRGSWIDTHLLMQGFMAWVSLRIGYPLWEEEKRLQLKERERKKVVPFLNSNECIQLGEPVKKPCCRLRSLDFNSVLVVSQSYAVFNKYEHCLCTWNSRAFQLFVPHFYFST